MTNAPELSAGQRKAIDRFLSGLGNLPEHDTYGSLRALLAAYDAQREEIAQLQKCVAAAPAYQADITALVADRDSLRVQVEAYESELAALRAPVGDEDRSAKLRTTSVQNVIDVLDTQWPIAALVIRALSRRQAELEREVALADAKIATMTITGIKDVDNSALQLEWQEMVSELAAKDTAGNALLSALESATARAEANEHGAARWEMFVRSARVERRGSGDAWLIWSTLPDAPTLELSIDAALAHAAAQKEGAHE